MYLFVGESLYVKNKLDQNLKLEKVTHACSVAP